MNWKNAVEVANGLFDVQLHKADLSVESLPRQEHAVGTTVLTKDGTSVILGSAAWQRSFDEQKGWQSPRMAYRDEWGSSVVL
jgi:hypothetical protein